MSARFVNLAILLLLVLELVSGFGSFLVGEPGGEWVFWLHRVGGWGLACLLFWKWGIAVRSYRRHGLTPGTAFSALAAILFLVSLGSGLLWATTGLPRLSVPLAGGWTGLSLHVAISLALVPLVVLHAAMRWPRPRRVDLTSRRAALRYLSLLAVGFALWHAQEAIAAAARLSGAERRFTGSREEASFQGNAHPVTNWLSDPVLRLDPAGWRLRVSGQVERELVLSYDEMLALRAGSRQALLDCTGGWYTVQRWSGVPVAALLEQAGVREGARSLIVRSATGYSRRFPLARASELLLATHVEGQPLSVAHGFPVRLVASGYRGYHWVKWVVELEVSQEPAWLQPPLPLQ
jgi:DMSO/TMAO reductase YedYZ molybdopterin-dependent catalytic subunit